MRLRSLIQLLLSLGLLLGSANWLHEHLQFDQRWPNIPALMAQRVSADDLRRQVQADIDADRPDDARMYLALAQRFGYAIEPQPYTKQIAAMQGPWQNAWRDTKAFSSGFVHGQADSAAGLAGVVTSDFTVVGDARDLWTQYQRYRDQEPVDDLIVALAGVGVMATAATVGSFGVVAPARAGVSLLKLAERGRHLSAPFRAYLLSRAGKVFDSRGFFQKLKMHPSQVIDEARAAYNPKATAQLEAVAGRINTIRKETSTADTLALLRHVDSPQDLRGAERLARKYGPQSRGIVRFLGKSAIKTTRVLRKTTQWMAAVISVAFAALSALLSALSVVWQVLKLGVRLLFRLGRGSGYALRFLSPLFGMTAPREDLGVHPARVG